MCGTSRPTNPIGPAAATAAPINNEVPSTSTRRTRGTSTPIDCAVTSPSNSASRSRACTRIATPPIKMAGAASNKWSQVRPSRPPRIQWMTWRPTS